MRWWALAFCIFLIACGQAEVEQTAVQPSEPAVQESANNGLKCVAQLDTERVTAYIKEGFIRLDSEPSGAHIINTIEDYYAWGDESPRGMTVNLKTVDPELATDFVPPSTDEMLARLKISRSQCEPFTLSQDLFVPPSNIQFADMSEMIAGMAQGMQQTE